MNGNIFGLRADDNAPMNQVLITEDLRRTPRNDRCMQCLGYGLAAGYTRYTVSLGRSFQQGIDNSIGDVRLHGSTVGSVTDSLAFNFVEVIIL